MDEFFKSKSMITPGVAGALVTLITNTLSSQFGLSAKWIAVVVSVLLALVIFFADQAGHVGARFVAFVLNAVIIFSVSVGTNTVATAKSQPTQPATPYESVSAPTPFFHPWFGQ